MKTDFCDFLSVLYKMPAPPFILCMRISMQAVNVYMYMLSWLFLHVTGIRITSLVSSSGITSLY
jgi:hypothetical protein